MKKAINNCLKATICGRTSFLKVIANSGIQANKTFPSIPEVSKLLQKYSGMNSGIFYLEQDY